MKIDIDSKRVADTEGMLRDGVRVRDWIREGEKKIKRRSKKLLSL